MSTRRTTRSGSPSAARPPEARSAESRPARDPEPHEPRRWAAPAPPDRLARNVHLAGLGILGFEPVYWLNQPCNSEFLCAPFLGMITLILFVPGL